ASHKDMVNKVVEIALKQAGQQELARAPRGHSLRTATCPTLVQLSAFQSRGWTQQERLHISACPHCRRIVGSAPVEEETAFAEAMIVSKPTVPSFVLATLSGGLDLVVQSEARVIKLFWASINVLLTAASTGCDLLLEAGVRGIKTLCAGVTTVCAMVELAVGR